MAAQFRVLGPIEALVDGHALDLGPARQRGVLAVLLIEPNRVVAVDQLVERIWGVAMAPRDPRSVLRTYLWQLRRALAAVADVALVHQAPGYKLRVDEQWVDLHRFRAMRAQANRTDEYDHAAVLLEQALGLWQGETFGALDTPWLASVRAVMESERYAAERDLTDLQLRLGRHGTLSARLSSQVSSHPLDERLSGQLMLALFRDGRPADALGEYQRLRARLADELGTDPGSTLQVLYQRILTDDPSLALAPAPSATFAPAAASTLRAEPVSAPRGGSAPRQLPAAPRWFTGRRDELDALLGLLGPLAHPSEAIGGADAVSVVAVHGMAGVGKTALAVSAAHRLAGAFPDGQLFIDLHAHTEAYASRTSGEALNWFLRALGVEPGLIPRDVEERAALYRQRLAGTRTLVVLDNAATEAQIRPLLPGVPGCLVLVTSRRRLKGLDEAHTVALDVLRDTDAQALLRAAIGDTRAAGEEAVVAEIAQWCGGLPLALRIAAALVRHRPAWSLEHLAQLLRDRRRRIGVLADGDRELGAVFDLSYRALPQAHRQLFRRLGLVPGPEVDAYAAAALTDTDPGSSQRLLEDLVDHNLLSLHAPGRYRMHALIRLHVHALADRDPAPERHAAIERLLYYYQHSAGRAEDLIARTPRAEPWDARQHAPLLCPMLKRHGRGCAPSGSTCSRPSTMSPGTTPGASSP